MKTLLSVGADPNFRPEGSRSVLAASIEAGRYEAAKLLLESGADTKAMGEVQPARLAEVVKADPRFRELMRKYKIRP